MLIAWSGGLDSTLALLYSIELWHNRHKEWDWGQGRYSKEHGAPRTFTVECSQINNGQQEMQNSYRRKFKKYIKKTYNIGIDESIVNIDSGGSFNGYGLPQPTLWMAKASLIINNDEPLMIGWLRSDHDVCRKLHIIKKMWKNTCRLNGRRNCPLWLPFIDMTKSEVLYECKKYNILDLCWWCEMPVKKGKSYKACGNCSPCLNMITANVRIHKKNAMPKYNYDEYVNWALDGYEFDASDSLTDSLTQL